MIVAGVKVRNLRKTYGNVLAADEVSFEAGDGEVTTILGPSGCGKTTTLRCIAGLEDVDAGEIFIGDELVSSNKGSVSPNKRNIGMVFQSYAVWPHMTVYENVAYGLKTRRVPREKIEEKVSNALSLVKLSDLGKRFPPQLSGGERQRVALARAIAYDPSILLLDEPLSNLDAKLRESTRFELAELQHRLGLTSIYVTHDQSEAMAISDQVIVMNRGKIAQVGSPRSIYLEPRDEFVANFVGSTNTIRGRLSATVSGGQDQIVDLENGETIHCRSHSGEVGKDVLVSLRPEKLELSESRANMGQPNWFECRVVSKAFLGDKTDYKIDVMGREWRVSSSTGKDLLEGIRLYVHIDPADVVVIRNL